MEFCDTEVNLSQARTQTPQHKPSSARSASSRRPSQFLGVFVEARESSRQSSTTSPPLHAIVSSERSSSQVFNLSGSDSESDSVIAPRMHSRAASRAVLAAKSRLAGATPSSRSPSTLDRIAVASDEDSDQSVFDNLVLGSTTSTQKTKESSLRSPIRPKEEEDVWEGNSVVPDVLPGPFAFPAFQAPSLFANVDREGSMDGKGTDAEDHGALPTPAATTTNPSSARGTSSAPTTPTVASPPVLSEPPPAVVTSLEASSLPSASTLRHPSLTTSGTSDPPHPSTQRPRSPELGAPIAGPSRAPSASAEAKPAPVASLKIRLKIKPVLPKLANATCHHDKSRNTRPKMSCVNYPTCKALWCDRCVNLHYSGPDDPPFVADESFLCPVCRGACLCAKCRRNRSRPSVVHAVVEMEDEEAGEPKVRTKRVVKKKRDVLPEDGIEESAVKRGKRRRVEVVQVVEAPVVTRSTSWRDGASEWVPVGAAEGNMSAASSDFDAEDDSDFDDWEEGGTRRGGGTPLFRLEPGLDDLPIQMEKAPVVWHEGPERRRRRTLLVNVEEKVGVGDALASEVEAAQVEAVFDELLVEHAAAQDQEDVKPYIRPPPDSFDALLHFGTHPHFDVFSELDPLRRSDAPPQHFELYDTLPPPPTAILSSPPPVAQPIPRHHSTPATIFPASSSLDSVVSHRRVPTPRFGMTGSNGAATILVDASLPTFHHMPYSSRASSLPYTSSVVTPVASREHLRTSPTYDRLGAPGGYTDLGAVSDAALGSAVRKAPRSGAPFFDQSSIHLSTRPLTPTFHRPLDRTIPIEASSPAQSTDTRPRHSQAPVSSNTRPTYSDGLVEPLGGGVAANPYRNGGLRDAPVVVDVDEGLDGGLLALDNDSCALMDTLVYEKVYRVEGGNLRWAEEGAGWGEFGGGSA